MSDCGSRDRVSKVISSWFYDESKHNFVVDFRVHGQQYGYTLQQQGDHVTQEKVEQLVDLLKELDPNGFTIIAGDNLLASERPKPEPLDSVGFPPFRQVAMRVFHEWKVPFLTAQLFTAKDLYRMLMNFLDVLNDFDRSVNDTRRTGRLVATDKQWLQCYDLLHHVLRAVLDALDKRCDDIKRLRDFDPEDACDGTYEEEEE